MTKRNSMRVFQAMTKQMDTKLKEPVSSQVRQRLSNYFNGDLDNPGPRSAEAPASTPVKPASKGEQKQAHRINPKDFGTAIAPAFDAWIEVYQQSQNLRRQLGEGIRQSEEYQELNAKKNAARRAFAAAVATKWPFEADAEASQMLSEANEALEKGRTLHQAYREGKGKRDAVLANWLALADRYPGTIEHDEALYWAGKLYLEHLRPGMKMEIPAARRIYERLARRPGPPSQWTLKAEENLVSFPDDLTQRMNMRSKLAKDMASRIDPEWLRAHMLVPTKYSTPDRFLRQIDEFLAIMVPARNATAHNMLSDAKGTPDRFENLKRLKEEHAENPFVEAAFSRDGEAPQTSFWTYLFRVALACLVVGAAIGGGIMLRRRRLQARTTVASTVTARRQPQR